MRLSFCLALTCLTLGALPGLAQSQWTDSGTYIYANNASDVVVTDSGEVGVGVTSPEADLHVGGTFQLDLGEGLGFLEDGSFWGSGLDARVIRLLDSNGTSGNVDGGLLFETFTPTDGYGLPLFTLRRKNGTPWIGLGAGAPDKPLVVHGSQTAGTGTLDSTGTTVYGTGTSFTSQLEVGAELLVDGEVRRVASIVDDSELTVNEAFSSNLSSQSFELTLPLMVLGATGNLGLGTDDPQTQLTLSGDAYKLLEFDRTERTEMDHRFYIGPSWDADGVDHLGFHTDGSGGTNMMVLKSSGNVGIGTDRPASRLVVTNNSFLGNTGWAVSIDSVTSDSTSAALHLRNSSASSLLYARSDGRVGLGTTSPTARLDVNGAIAVGGTTVIDAAGDWVGAVPGVDLVSDQTIAGAKTFSDQVTAGDGLISMDTLQVGDSSNGERIELYASDTAMDLFRVGGSQFGSIRTNSSHDFVLHALVSGSKVRVSEDLHLRYNDLATWRNLFAGDITADGSVDVIDNLDVGLDIDVQRHLDVHGNLTMHSLPTGSSSGQVCYSSSGSEDRLIRCSSSRRYKDDIADFTSGIASVQALRPVTFSWKESGEPDVGFVAEEVAQIDELLVTRHGGEIDGVKYDRLTTLLVNAVQEQQTQIEQLQAIICLDHPDMEWCEIEDD